MPAASGPGEVVLGAPANPAPILAALIDGVRGDTLSIADRGLHYGDGLFETISLRRGAPCLWSEHLARLRRGAERLAIPLPDSELLLRECRVLADGVVAGVAKLILTRGAGGRGYRPPHHPQPSRILLLYPQPVRPESVSRAGVAVRWCETRLGENPRLAGIKHLNRLEQVLARAEWNPDAGADACAEGLMCDCRGRVIAGTMSNLFVYARGRLLTPRLDTCGVAGTARALVLRRAPTEGLPVAEADLYRDDLVTAEGFFLTNAVNGVWPIRRLGDQVFDVERLPLGLMAVLDAAIFAPLPE